MSRLLQLVEKAEPVISDARTLTETLHLSQDLRISVDPKTDEVSIPHLRSNYHPFRHYHLILRLAEQYAYYQWGVDLLKPDPALVSEFPVLSLVMMSRGWPLFAHIKELRSFLHLIYSIAPQRARESGEDYVAIRTMLITSALSDYDRFIGRKVRITAYSHPRLNVPTTGKAKYFFYALPLNERCYDPRFSHYWSPTQRVPENSLMQYRPGTWITVKLYPNGNRYYHNYLTSYRPKELTLLESDATI